MEPYVCRKHLLGKSDLVRWPLSSDCLTRLDMPENYINGWSDMEHTAPEY